MATPVSKNTTPISRDQQIASIAAQAKALQSMLSSGKVTGLTPSKSASYYTSPASSGLSPKEQANEAAAQAIRFGTSTSTTPAPQPTAPTPPVSDTPGTSTGISTITSYQPSQYQQYTPVTPQTSGADAYYKQLLDSMKQTQEEVDLQNQQTDLNGKLKNFDSSLNQRTVDTQGQPIASGFIQGQNAAIARQGAVDRSYISNDQQTLQEKLANLQQRRQSAIDVAKAGVNYGQSKDTAINAANQQNFQNIQSVNASNANQYQQNFNNTQLTAAQQAANKIAQQNANTTQYKSQTTSNNSLNKDEQQLLSGIQAAQDNLRSGTSWGDVWSSLYGRFKTNDEAHNQQLREYLDGSLGKNQWSQPGAYQQYKASTSGGVQIPTFQ